MKKLNDTDTRRDSGRDRVKQIFVGRFITQILEEKSAVEREQVGSDSENSDSLNEQILDDAEVDIYTSYASYMSSSDPGSDNLLVTFDYGFEDSFDADLSFDDQQVEQIAAKDNELKNNLFKITEEKSLEDLLMITGNELLAKSQNIFKVHQMQHMENESNSNTRASSCISLQQSSLIDRNIDTSGDYGSWAQSDSDVEEKNNGEKLIAITVMKI
ncbi:hypothetical protein EVAR_71961_1 [Eumeta japonica]|uniref:Uncharacterized protein n=1 Tax=Eumeta variegata TaxID=151549 RepID=A0A4C1TG91_EUMVA|nr:hypothetical protein EVAR_71961_1 [Eumeta japonica]